MAPSRPYDGGHGAGDGPPPQRSRSEEKSGGGAERGGVAREARRHKWPGRNSSVGRAARASVCAAAAGRSYVCGCWSFLLSSSPAARWRLLSGQRHGVLSRPFGGGIAGGAGQEKEERGGEEGEEGEGGEGVLEAVSGSAQGQGLA